MLITVKFWKFCYFRLSFHCLHNTNAGTHFSCSSWHRPPAVKMQRKYEWVEADIYNRRLFPQRPLLSQHCAKSLIKTFSLVTGNVAGFFQVSVLSQTEISLGSYCPLAAKIISYNTRLISSNISKNISLIIHHSNVIYNYLDSNGT